MAVSGLIFTNLDEGEKVVQVSLIAAGQAKFFTFFFQIPDMRVEGKPIFMDRISRDIGVRFKAKTCPSVTHKIDPDIDQAHFALIGDLIFSQMLALVRLVPQCVKEIDKDRALQQR